jgi:hypothetical protein
MRNELTSSLVVILQWLLEELFLNVVIPHFFRSRLCGVGGTVDKEKHLTAIAK